MTYFCYFAFPQMPPILTDKTLIDYSRQWSTVIDNKLPHFLRLTSTILRS